MSIKATYIDGVFKPIDQVTDAVPGMTYRVFSEEELRELNENLHWMKAAERNFEFWNNKKNAVYDNL